MKICAAPPPGRGGSVDELAKGEGGPPERARRPEGRRAQEAGGLQVTVPSWRPDIGGENDLIEEVLRLHHATTTAQRHKEIVEQLGDPPPAHSRERGYGMSMWLASACVALHEACKVQAGDLLATRSTAGRLERVLKVLKAEIAKKYSPPRGRQRG